VPPPPLFPPNLFSCSGATVLATPSAAACYISQIVI